MLQANYKIRIYIYIYICVCVCVCVWMYTCVCVCERERERERVFVFACESIYLSIRPIVGGLEYSDCIPFTGCGRTLTIERCPEYDTKLHLMLTVHFWSFSE